MDIWLVMPGHRCKKLKYLLSNPLSSQSERVYYCSRIMNGTKQTFKALHFSSYLLSSSLIVFSCLATSRVHSSVRIMSKQRRIYRHSYILQSLDPQLSPRQYLAVPKKKKLNLHTTYCLRLVAPKIIREKELVL